MFTLIVIVAILAVLGTIIYPMGKDNPDRKPML